MNVDELWGSCMKHWLKPYSLKSNVFVPGSKSLSNRYLILGALKNDFFEIKNISNSDDTILLAKALEKIGCSVHVENNSVKIKGPFPEIEKKESKDVIIHVGEGGTTARFLAPLLALGKNKYILKLQGNLSVRPWTELIEAIKSLGASCDLQGDELIVQGPILFNHQEIQIDCSRSSQFASALALAFSSYDFKIILNNLSSSIPYWEMTQEVLKNKNLPQVVVANDWSSAAPLMALAAITNGNVLFKNLSPDSFQADSVFGAWLEKRSALKYSSDGGEVLKLKDLSPIQVDVRNHQDLFPVWCYIASHMKGVSLITGLQGLRHKETDRVATVLEILDQLKVKYRLDENKLEITGPIEIHESIELTPAFDHRIVMMASIFLATHQGGSVSNAEAVNKSYPNFFDQFKTIE